MKVPRPIAPLAAFGIIALISKVAEACPYCAQNTPDDNAFYWLMLSMILLPFVVAGIVIYFIRRTTADANELATERTRLSVVRSPRNPESQGDR